MRASVTRDLLLFTGQGSSSHFTDSATFDGLLLQLGEPDREAYHTFADTCLKAFRSELQSLDQNEQSIFENVKLNVFNAFNTSRALLLPPQSYQSHPIIETISLYLRHILELFVYQSRQSGENIVVETAGLCTGVLPAILSSSFTAYNTSEFISAATQGFRLAFWIGLRSALYAKQKAGKEWQASSWVLGVFGLTVEALEDKIESYNNGSTVLHPWPCISTVFNDDQVFIAGHPQILQHFSNQILRSETQTRTAHIHAYYHGGSKMECLVEQVFEDAYRRSIDFPVWRALEIPVRYATTGLHLEESGSDSLLLTALRSIFVDKGDWNTTRKAIVESSMASINRDSQIKYRIVGFGPGSKALIQPSAGLPCHKRLSIVESVPDFLIRSAPDGIAMVGLSVNYPSGHGKKQFWESLASGLSSVEEIPKTRFDVGAYHEANEDSTRKLETWYGNFLNQPFEFDPSFFNISPREAKSMDPQQRLLLLAALDALEDAGYTPDSTPTNMRETFGTYVGVATGDYVDNLREDIDVYYSPGTLRSFLAGRVSYAFDWSGPSMVIDTACSSSAVSIYHACRALASRECNAALAGGVNTISSPDMYIGLDRAHFLSPTGQCKPWDVSADGYCRGEGCGLVVLKRLADAIDEGDHIYGVIRGIGINQCGTSKSITHPDSETQAALFRDVLNTSGTSPESINVVEAHGTGTQAGDFCEASSLSTIFGERDLDNPLHLSSIKGNIGHAEAASGLAGLAKILMMLEHNAIPPQASFKELNPRLEAIKNGHLIVPTGLTEWKSPNSKVPRRALLNNFGASGSNAAVVIEEYIAPSQIQRRNSTSKVTPLISRRSQHILNISAKSEKALESSRKRLIEYIESKSDLRVEDLCYTVNARRQEYATYRSSIVNSSLIGILDQLKQGPARSQKPSTGKPRQMTVFAFSGQGGIYRGMGKELLTTATVFRDTISQIDNILISKGFPSVTPYLTNDNIFRELSRNEQIITEQLSVFSVEFALAKLWSSWGVTPDVVVGHSVGEYAALVIAEVLTLESAITLIANRAKLMTMQCETGSSGMITCRMERDDLDKLLNDDAAQFKSLEIACYNSFEDHVVSGPWSALETFAMQCTKNGIKHKQLPVPYGFHSVAMDLILHDLDNIAGEININKANPKIKIGSSLYGRILKDDETVPTNYFSRHSREPVKFSSVVEELEDHFARTDAFVIEIGPSPSTSQMFRKTIEKVPYTFLASLKPEEEPWVRLSQSLQTLFLQRYPIKWREVYEGAVPKFLITLPHYPLSTVEHVVPYSEPSSVPMGGSGEIERPEFDLLSWTTGRGSLSENSSFASTVTSMDQVARFIRAHAVGGVPLCPASVYMEIAVEARAITDSTVSPGSLHVFEEFTFDKPYLCLDDQEAWDQASLTTELRGRPGENLQLTFTSQGSDLHCAGRHSLRPSEDTPEMFARRKAFVNRQRLQFNDPDARAMETFATRTIYDVIFPRVVDYSTPFCTLKQLTINKTGLEGLGTFQMQVPKNDGRFVCHPSFIDTLLHAAGFIANTTCPTDVACICTRIEQAVLPSERLEELHDQPMQVYCSLVDLGHTFVADAYALSFDDELLAYVEGMSFKKIALKSFKTHLSRVSKAGIKSNGDKISRVGSKPLCDGAKTPKSGNVTPRSSSKLPQAGQIRKAIEGAKQSKQHEESQPNLQDTFQSIVSSVCGIERDLATNLALEELGIDSLLFIELIDAIGQQFPDMNISKPDLEACSTLSELFMVLSKAADEGSQTNTAPTIQTPTSNDTEDIADVDGVIEGLVEEVCGLTLSDADKTDALANLGVDSLLSIELLHELQDRHQLDIEGGSEAISDMNVVALQELYVQKLSNLNPGSTSRRGIARIDSTREPKPKPASSTDSRSPSPVSAPNSTTSSFSSSTSNLSFAATPAILGTAATSVSPSITKSSLVGKRTGSAVKRESQDRGFPRILQEQRSGHAKSALYLFHDGSGMTSSYSRIHDLNRTVYGFYSPDDVPMDPQVPRMEDLAALYIKKSGLGSDSNIILGGWSFGGVLAFEVARQLRCSGCGVRGLILIDSPPPINHVPLPEEVINLVFGGDSSTTQRKIESKRAKKMRVQLKERFLSHAAMLQNYNPRAEGELPCIFIKCTQTMDTKKSCGISYPWLSDASYRDQTREMWESLSGRPVTILGIDCNHFDVFEKQHIQTVSNRLALACEMIESEVAN